MNPLQDLDISTEGHFEKEVFKPFDFKKVLIDEGNNPGINFFNEILKQLICHILV